MGKKKRGHPDVEELLARPWCYYCERDFDDLKILINHQKAKHFKCERCGRRLNTAGGLNVHMSQVHKEALSAVDNALPNRAGLDIEIFGMEGIPDDVVQQHTQRVVSNYHQNEETRRATSGQGGAAGANSGAKKPKFESPSDLKKRLAEHKAKLAAEQTGGSSGGGTPMGAGQSPGAFQNSPQYPTQAYPASNGSPAYPPQQQTFGAPLGAALYPPPQQQQQQQQQQPQPPFNGAGGPPFGYPQPLQQPGAYLQNGYPPQPSFSPPPTGYPLQPPNAQPYPLQYSPSVMQGGPSSYQTMPPSGPPGSFGAQSPLMPYPQNQQPSNMQIPPQNGSLPVRPGSLPPAPGLPQRPAFEAPHVNAFQMQQMHQGQIHGPPSHGISQAAPGVNEPSSLDELISGASKQAEEAQAPVAASASSAAVPNAASAVGFHPESTAFPAVQSDTKKPEDQGEEKAGKKEKFRGSTRLVYADNEVSPEEKMASLPRYAINAAA